jgi:hypothetical protein
VCGQFETVLDKVIYLPKTQQSQKKTKCLLEASIAQSAIEIDELIIPKMEEARPIMLPHQKTSSIATLYKIESWRLE